jgi:DNA-binding transcriptional LysR family regulator
MLPVTAPVTPTTALAFRPTKTENRLLVSVANLLDTQMALVEADEGIAIIPSFGMAACRNRQVVMNPLVDPVASMEFHQITRRGRSLPEGADEFLSFLKAHVSGWAERVDVV